MGYAINARNAVEYSKIISFKGWYLGRIEEYRLIDQLIHQNN